MVLFPGSELMNVALTKVIDLSATGLSTYGSAVETYEDNFDDDPTQALAHMLECFGSVLLLIGAIHSWPDMNIEYFAMACCSLAPVLYMLATHHTKHMKKQEKREAYVDQLLIILGYIFLDLSYVLVRFGPIHSLCSEVFGYMILLLCGLYYTIYPSNKILPRFGVRDNDKLGFVGMLSNLCFVVSAVRHYLSLTRKLVNIHKDDYEL